MFRACTTWCVAVLNRRPNSGRRVQAGAERGGSGVRVVELGRGHEGHEVIEWGRAVSVSWPIAPELL
jgi:hypothetical protein